MTKQNSPEVEAWVEDARRISTYAAFEMLPNKTALKKSSEGFAGPCPSCGGRDRFAINVRENTWLCRQCGLKGGDGIQLVMDMQKLSFFEACEFLTNIPKPGGRRDDGKKRYDEDALRERAEERQIEDIKAQEREAEFKAEKRSEAEQIFEDCKPFKGSLAEKYLRNRRIVLPAEMTTDLRFTPKLDYFGFEKKESDEQTLLGAFPAMVAAIRDVDGNIIGVYRTYIDPKTVMKLTPPGDRNRNAAKKVYGEQNMGSIRLGPIKEFMVIGEGIETTASFYMLGIGPADLGFIVGVNLGNIAGKSTGSKPHPAHKMKKIPNGIPAPAEDQKAFIPPKGVTSLTLLVDVDDDPAATIAKNLCAGRRLIRDFGVLVGVCDPGIKGDFNTLLMKQPKT